MHFLAFVNENLLQLYRKTEDNDCQALFNFGVKVLHLLRRARVAVSFYVNTQKISVGIIDWDTEMHNVQETVYKETVSCMNSFKIFAKSVLKKQINHGSPSEARTVLENNYYI